MSVCFIVCYLLCLLLYITYLSVNYFHTMQYGWTPLHVAVDKGHAAAVSLLLKAGADNDPVNEVNK